jgi:hypothetical protein
MNRLPKIERVSELRKVSFYQLKDLHECRLKGVRPNLHLTVSLPDAIPTKALMVGRFHHKAIELARTCLTIGELREALESEIGRLEESAAGYRTVLPRGRVSGWNEINDSFVRAVEVFRRRTSSDLKGKAVSVEKSLSSADGLFVGKPDLYVTEGDGATVIEYKTPALRAEAGDIRAEYYDQLKFYAALLYESYDLEAVVGRLESPIDTPWQVDISKAEALGYLAEARECVASVNSAIRSMTNVFALASPAVESCAVCDLRPVCGPFLNTQRKLEPSSPETYVDGVLMELDIEANGRAAKAKFALNDKESLVIVLPQSVYEELRCGRRYLLAALYVSGAGREWSGRSQIFQDD